ncbi:MAG: ABC transporter permease [Fusobacteria bacterium]|nr:ABC transporter permease [Fusobacteriota bacterium]
MNIILHELRIHLKSIIIWSISIALLIMMSMVKYDAISGTGADFIKLIESMPKALQVMIGGGYFDLLLPIGFFGASFLYIMFLGAIHGSMLGASILAKEERDKTTEFLLVKPVTRSKLVAMKLIAALLIIAMMTIVVFFSAQFIVGSYSDPSTLYFKEISQLVAGYLMIELIFMASGLFISIVIKRVRFAASLASLILFLTLFLNIFAELFEKVDFLKYFSPFSWFDPKLLLGILDLPSIFIFLGIIAIIIPVALSFYFYNRREMEI